jgi:hypothetical protein
MNGATARGALAAAAAAALPVGLHLNLSEGTPLSPLASVASLLEPGTSVFRGKAGFRAALAAGAIDEREAVVEAAAQLDAFLAAHPSGALPSHWDGHQHVHVARAGAREGALVEALGSFFASRSVRLTRLPRLSVERVAREELGARASFYETVSAEAEAAESAFAARGVLAPRAFLGFTTMGADCAAPGRLSSLLGALSALADAHAAAQEGGQGGRGLESGAAPLARPLVAEWMFHPGAVTPPTPPGAPHAAGCGEGPDDFSQDRGREVERDALLWSGGASPATAQEGGAGAPRTPLAASLAALGGEVVLGSYLDAAAILL